MKRYCLLSVGLLLLASTIVLFSVGCAGTPETERPPTPTPLPGGSIFFDPSRASRETRAIEVRVIDVSGSVPTTESATVITAPLAIEAITATLLAATSRPPVEPPAMPQEARRIIALYLYSRKDIVPLDGTSSQWMITSLTYDYQAGVIAVERQALQGDREVVLFPIGPELQVILEREGVFPSGSN